MNREKNSPETRRARIESIKAALLFFGILIAAVAIGSLLVVFRGVDPLVAYGIIFKSTFGSPQRVVFTLSQSAPLIFVSLGLLIAFKGGFWNLGGEGQIFIGAMVGLIVGYLVRLDNAAVMLPLVYVAAFIGGGAWASISGVLKVKYHVDEIVSTLLLNFVASYLIFYLIRVPFKNSFTNIAALLESVEIPPASRTPSIFGLNIIFPMAIAVAVIVFYVLKDTKFGFKVKVMGDNRLTAIAAYGARRINRLTIMVSFISGGLVGVGGLSIVSAFNTVIIAGATGGAYSAGGFTNSYGFIGIAAILLAQLNPLIAIPASIFFVALVIGGLGLLIKMAIPSSLTLVIAGVAIFFVAARSRIIEKITEGQS